MKQKPSPVRVLKGILLADDSPDDIFLFLDLMRRNRIRNPVMLVHDGDEVIAYLKREGRFVDPVIYPQPSALFLDLKMPKLSGFEVLRWISVQPNLKNLLRIVLTHHCDLKNVHQAYELGAQSFLTKPVTHAELNNLMQKFEPYFCQWSLQNQPARAESINRPATL